MAGTVTNLSVVPANAGTNDIRRKTLGSRVRGNDESVAAVFTQSGKAQ